MSASAASNVTLVLGIGAIAFALPLSAQPSSQPSAASSQPAAGSSQPSAASSQPAAGSSQPAAGSSQPAAASSQPAAASSQPAAASSQPAAASSSAEVPDASVAPEDASLTAASDDGVRIWHGTAADDYVHFRRLGAHLNVNFTPTLDALFPPDRKKTPADHVVAEAADGSVTVARHPDRDEGGSLSFVILPDLRYNPEEGLGVGVAIPIVWTEPGVTPYKYSFILQMVASTKLVQDHAVMYDLVDILGLPLRLTGATGLYAFADEPHCGVGSTVTCDPAVAQAEAARRGLTGGEAAEFEKEYYIMRIMRPYNWSVLRIGLFDFLGKWELFTGLRSEWYIPGFFGNPFEGELFQPGAYEGSVFAQRGDAGEPGYVNVPQLGLMVDSRDFEPSPRTGYWVESSVRGAHPWALSSWPFAGFNTTARFYVPLLPSKTLTLATRFIADVIVGDAPVQELARVGGSLDYRAFGGRWVGRGMRQQRYVGNLKFAHQTELRWDAIRFDVNGFALGFEFATFLDAGVVLAEGVDYALDEGLKEPIRPLMSGGVGVRWVINRNIVVRADIGFSPEEGFFPQFYIDGRHTF